MKPKAIVYTSNTGHTAAYARLLGERTGLPAYSLDAAGEALKRGCPIIYMGWIMAGKLKGYRKAARRYEVMVACGVGMVAGGMNADRLRAVTGIRSDIDVHSIPGGFEPEKLTGATRFLGRLAAKKVAANLRAKSQRSPEEENLLKLTTAGEAQIDPARLDRLVEWYGRQKK